MEQQRGFKEVLETIKGETEQSMSVGSADAYADATHLALAPKSSRNISEINNCTKGILG
jgi:hypothetical protein